jgi:dihydroorotate dehydrogenase
MKVIILKLINFVYRFVIKPVLFLLDPEKVHDRALLIGMWFSRHKTMRGFLGFFLASKHPVLEQSILGIMFRSPLGLAAGFDKNADLVSVCPALGFGFEEIGSITALSSPGNPKPRLWRFPRSRSLLVWYGLKNDGGECIKKTR